MRVFLAQTVAIGPFTSAITVVTDEGGKISLYSLLA